MFLERAAGRVVVLKAVTDEHKLRLDLVMTNLRTAEQLSGAWRDLASRSAPPFPVREQVESGPDVVIGAMLRQSRIPVFDSFALAATAASALSPGRDEPRRMTPKFFCSSNYEENWPADIVSDARFPTEANI